MISKNLIKLSVCITTKVCLLIDLKINNRPRQKFYKTKREKKQTRK